ncbi:MAG: hypothetical protein ACYTF0_03665, partial [Planctomycetota bacterium]
MMVASGDAERRRVRGHVTIDSHVRNQLESNPAWQHHTVDGRWVCPFCLATVRSPQEGQAPLQRAIDRHLSSRCSAYKQGKGELQPGRALAERLLRENIAYRVYHDPAWQVFDHEGYWYSPLSLTRIDSVRIRGQRLDPQTMESLVSHILTAPEYRSGHPHEASEVQGARDRAIRTARLGSNIGQLLSHPIWRYSDPNGHWVCPYCLDHVEHVIAIPGGDWQALTPGMATHLIEQCEHFTPTDKVMHRESEVAAAAGSPFPHQQDTSSSTLPVVTMPSPVPIESIPSVRSPSADNIEVASGSQVTTGYAPTTDGVVTTNGAQTAPHGNSDSAHSSTNQVTPLQPAHNDLDVELPSDDDA